MNPRSEALTALSQFLVTDGSLLDTLQRVTEITAQAMSRAELAGIAMIDETGRASTRVFTDEEAPEIDKSQYGSGRGPCLDAWHKKEVIRLDTMTGAESDYPEFAEACKQHGVLSTLSLPLIAGSEGVGALNLYSRKEWGFTPDDEAVGTELASAAAIVLMNSTAYWGAFELGEQLSEAMKSRAVIEQAKGMLMARSPDLTADDAFGLLRRASQRENVKLRDIAQRIVDRQQ